MMMKFGASLLLGTAPGAWAQPRGRTGKSTIASAHPMESMEFLLRYLPVAVAEDNGVGNEGHGAVQGRTQAVLSTSYSAQNCQLFSAENSLSSSSSSESMTPSSVDQSESVGNDCTYKSKQSFGTTNTMWKVYANNQVQCCNACISTKGCAAATFSTSSNDHSGGQGPQSWEGFGIHLPNVLESKTTGGVTVDELEAKYAARIGDHSEFDAFMDYSTAFFTYDLQHYIDIFTADNVQHFLGQWIDGSKRQWYSMIFLVPQSSYVIELISTRASVEASSLPETEQRMSDDLCTEWIKGEKSANNAIEQVSINRAASDLDAIDNAYTTYMGLTTSHTISDSKVQRRCYQTSSSFDVCFTKRESSADADAIFSVKDHEDNMWAIHAGVMGTDPTVTDKMTDSHAGFSASTTKLEVYFLANNFATLLENRLAYACAQSYVIDPTGFSIQAGGPGGSSFPGCGWSVSV
jgi:hypothetical protein